MRIENLGVAQNIAKSTNYALKQATQSDLKDNQSNTLKSSTDSSNLTFHGAIGGADHDYSKEDAITNAWNKENSFNINDVLNGGKITLGNTTPPADFVEKLEKEGVSSDVDWFSTDKDFKSMSADELKQSVDYMASKYAVLNEQINQNFTGEELENQLNKLNEMAATYKEKIATEFSDEVGDFLEENGATGEKEKIYQSVVSEFDKKVNEYSSYIENNKDYAAVNGTKDEWLKNDSSFMASELRNVMESTATKTKSTNDTYSLEELEAVQDVVTEIKSYGFGAKSKNSVGTADSEESIGLKLSELALKTKVFTENSNISDSLKDALTKSTDSFINKTIDDIDTELKKKSVEAMISADKKGYAPLNKDDIYSVINHVMSSHEKTGSASKALKDGAVFAMDAFNKKMDNSGDVYRYKGNQFANFYDVQDKQMSGGSLTSSTYRKETSDLESMINSFNSFVNKFELGQNNLMQLSEFSAYA